MGNFVIMLKLFFYSCYYQIAVVNDTTQDIDNRFEAFLKLLGGSTIIVYILNVLDIWFQDNQAFAIGIVILVFLNMLLGIFMHHKKGDFRWEVLLIKTIRMIVVLLVTYVVLELVATVAGKNLATDVFRAAIQVATLLYPGTKILKNIFILSNGEHPPAWIMNKIYNFQENGDLSEFIKTKKEEDVISDDIEDIDISENE